MTIDQQIQRIDQMIAAIDSFMNRLLNEVGHIIVDAVKNRVEQTGTNYKGQKFSPYSSKTSLVGGQNWLGKGKADTFFENAKFVTLKKGENIRRLGVLDGGYKEFRDLNGLQTSFKDFHFTSTMWQKFTYKVDLSTGIITLYFDSVEATKKAQGNTDREGYSIIMPSEKEIETVQLYMKGEIAEFMKQLKAA